MTVFTTGGSSGPAWLAYCAAGIFAAASIATNAVYGWSKGGDIASSAVWAAVSVAAGFTQVLSWPALIRSLEVKRWSSAGMAFFALLLAGSYSVTAALGSAAGGRMNAAATETAASGAQKRAQTAYAKAEVGLAKLAPSRTVGELEAFLAAAQRDPRRYGCSGVNGSTKVSCPKLDGELARAKTREKLGGELSAASKALSTEPAKVANSDAKALARYLTAVGLEIEADRLNDILTLLAVVMIESGGGLSLALGLALSGPGGHVAGRRTSTHTEGDRTTGHGNPDTSQNTSIPEAPTCPPTPDISPQPAPDTTDKTAASVRFLTYLQDRGGVLVSGQREMGRALGWSKSWMHEVLHDLAGAGLVKLKTGKAGTVVRLAAAA